MASHPNLADREGRDPLCDVTSRSNIMQNTSSYSSRAVSQVSSAHDSKIKHDSQLSAVDQNILDDLREASTRRHRSGDDHDQSFIDYSTHSSHTGRTEFVSKRGSAYSEKFISNRGSTYSEHSVNINKRGSTYSEQYPDRRASAYSDQSSRYQEPSNDSRRVSKASTASRYSTLDGQPSRKTHIGPWELGKTLGKGSSARVRYARHCVTGQEVAVKIVTKDTAKVTQSGSIANLAALTGDNPVDAHGNKRMPLSIEREVAILKSIDHPNVTKLYDIWENNDEIYLVMEYVEGGDLFSWINRNGPMSEMQAMWVFRQLMSAIDHCHTYNICHRDLKPENILLGDHGQIKLADFSMAALHQDPEHELRTSCGSPHYAAPELLKGHQYRGSKADIWSMGVILFAMLAAHLPFYDEDMDTMLAKAKRGIYEIPPGFSYDAKNLIQRILQTDPAKRISMKEMWEHPLVFKYGYVDELTGIDELPDIRAGKQVTPLTFSSIDQDIFRQLASMWHGISEDLLTFKLVNNESNDQKLFYWLLYNYRERKLENYNPGLTSSPSDNHILRPATWTRKYSTRQFSQPNPSGHGRSVSRFTVISNVTDSNTDVGTFASYDPYNASLDMTTQASHAKITVHRNMSRLHPSIGTLNSRFSSVARRNSMMRRRGSTQYAGASARFRSPHPSMSSIMSSRQGTFRSRRSSRYRRGMDFSGVRKTSTYSKRMSMDSTKAPASIAGDESTFGRGPHLPSSPPRTKNQHRPGEHRYKPGVARIIKEEPERSPAAKLTKDLSEDLIQFSSSIAKEFDDAFGRSLLDTSPILDDDESTLPTQLTLTLNLHKPTPATPDTSTNPWDTRPLPPTPSVSDASPPGLPQPTGKGKAIAFADQVASMNASNIKNLPPHLRAEAMRTPTADRRTVSTPVYAEYSRTYQPEANQSVQLDEYGKTRAVSAPSPGRLPTPHENKGLEFLSRAENTIRLIQSPSAQRPADPDATPRPLTVRKKLTKGISESQNGKEIFTLPGEVKHHRQFSFDSNPQADVSAATYGTFETTITPKRKLSSWFRRSRSDLNASSTLDASTPPATLKAASKFVSAQPPARNDSHSTAELPSPPKKKGFGLSFWKGSRSIPKLSMAGPDYNDRESGSDHANASSLSSYPSKRNGTRSRQGLNLATGPYEEEDSATRRNIEPQQNWLARLFRVKPATRYLCLGISRKRARQEVAILLREWRRYGMKDIEVDKERNIVFARVGGNNYLQIREVAFACEVMTVIEHGKRNHLSILRFTQEKGAASSFHRVVNTMSNVFTSRGLHVADKRKAKMMIKTRNS